jgi:hypothetical protein
MNDRVFVIGWKDKSCFTELRVSAKSQEEAFERAKELGWTKRKWWQIRRWGDYIFSI